MAKKDKINLDGLNDQNLNEGLEGNMPEASDAVGTEGIEWENREVLETKPFEFIKDLASTKYDEKREPKVQGGLLTIQELMGEKINPLLILLGKWWENKTARSAIKKMIDAEAAAKNIPEDVYLQQILRENVDKLAEVQSAVDRLRYAITYFKPRGGVGIKPVFKPMSINGVNYNVNLAVLTEAKELFGDDKEQIKLFVIEKSEKIEIEEYL